MHSDGPTAIRPLHLALTAVVASVAFAAALPHAVQAGDSGEFATLALRGGIAHPPGYPLMRLLSGPASALAALGCAPMIAAAALPALFGAAAAVFVAVCGSRLRAPHAGVAFALVFASASTVLRHVPDAEVWGLHLFLSGLFVATALRERPVHPIVLGALLGLACTQHLTAVFLTPLAIAAAWPPGASIRSLLRAGARGLLGVLIGLTPFLTLTLGSGGAVRWGDVKTASGLLRHITRAEYGTLSLSLQDVDVSAIELMVRSAGNTAHNLSAGAIAGPVGAAFLAIVWIGALRLRPEHLRPRIWLGLHASLVLAQPVFAAIQNLSPQSPFSVFILERFDLLPIVLWCVILAGAAGELARRTALASRLSARRLHWLPALVVLVLVTSGFLSTFGGGVPRDHEAVQTYALDVLSVPEPAGPALVIGTDDHRTFPLLYAQQVLAAGSQVIYVDASLLSLPWYRAHLRTRFPDLPEVDKPVRLIAALWADPRHRDMPIYLTHVFSRPADSLPRVAEGILWRVVAPHLRQTPAFSVQEVTARHQAAMDRLQGPAPATFESDPFGYDLSASYADFGAVAPSG